MMYEWVFKAKGKNLREKEEHFKKAPEEVQSLLRMTTSGSTTRPYEMSVIYMGENYSLLRHHGGSYTDNGGSHYVSGWIELVPTKQPFRYSSWNLGKVKTVYSKGGRIKNQVILGLVELAKKVDSGEMDISEVKQRLD